MKAVPAQCLDVESSELNALDWRTQGSMLLRLQEMLQQSGSTPLDHLIGIRYLFGTDLVVSEEALAHLVLCRCFQCQVISLVDPR